MPPAYALFLSANVDSAKQRLGNSDASCPQRDVLKQAGADWRALPDAEKEEWNRRSAQEHSAKTAAIDRLYSGFTETAEQAVDVGAAVEDDPGLLTLGNFVLTNETLWTGYSVKGFRCYHKTLHYNAMELKFEELSHFRHEVKILHKISEQTDPCFQELFLQVMQGVHLHGLANCLILEPLPVLETWVRENAPLAQVAT